MPAKSFVYPDREYNKFRVPVKIWTDEVEPSAQQQLENLAQLPFIHKHIAVMPDVHAGIGSTIGSVIPTIKAIIPAAVGVDIGCGMMAVNLGIKSSRLPDNLAPMRAAIEAAVPHGRTDNGGANDRGAWGTLAENVSSAAERLQDQRFWDLREKHGSKIFHPRHTTWKQLGTLGTGNHFVEVCISAEDDVWVMLHSGSRGIGNKIGSYFIERAKEQMERWHVQLPDPALAFLPEGEALFDDYINAMLWAQDYARVNREIMMQNTLQAIRPLIPMTFPLEVPQTMMYAVNCHHNFAEMENHFGKNVWITRKGAVRARTGELGIIPGSMGAKSFIVRGKGNPESFCSCSHGAGRVMSRSKARAQFTLEDIAVQTAGVECRKDIDVVDEIPAAYKDIDKVMADQSDLVEIVTTLKQVLCVKG